MREEKETVSYLFIAIIWINYHYLMRFVVLLRWN
jgi:hypothetical protein